MKSLKKLFIIIFSIVIIATVGIYAIWHNEIVIVASIKTILNQKLSLMIKLQWIYYRV